MQRTDASGARGREQPSGPASGRQRPQDRGVAHAPAPQRRATIRAFAAGKERRPHARHTPLAVAASRCGCDACYDQKARGRHRADATVAFRASRYGHDNHRALSRLPSRRQPFRTRRCRPRVRDESTDVREHGNQPVRCGVREPRPGGATLEDRGDHHRVRSTVCRAPDSVALRT
jgi:hypothetical protein